MHAFFNTNQEELKQLKYLITFVLGFLLSGIWFGCHILCKQIMHKKKLDRFEAAQPLLSALLPTLVIWLIKREVPLHIAALCRWKLWGILMVTVLLTCLIKLGARSSETVHLPTACLEAALMELPQRAMMQTFVCMILEAWKLNYLYGVLINAFIWVVDIIVQAIIFKRVNVRELTIDALASFVFSIGVGYVFYDSECLLLTMLAHAAERFIVSRLSRRNS